MWLDLGVERFFAEIGVTYLTSRVNNSKDTHTTSNNKTYWLSIEYISMVIRATSAYTFLDPGYVFTQACCAISL